MSKVAPCIVLFRQDLRLQDNPALRAAWETGVPVLPVYIWSPEEEGGWKPGAASRWWLHQSLERLNAEFDQRGSRLVIRSGETISCLRDLIHSIGAKCVFWNRRWEPEARAQERRIEKMLADEGIEGASFNASLLLEPGEMKNTSGAPFRVFTPFYRACMPRLWTEPAIWSPADINFYSSPISSLSLSDLKLLPSFDWASGMRENWVPGEVGAASRLRQFVACHLNDYVLSRDDPSSESLSGLSPHLHFGEIGPRQVLRAIQVRSGLTQIAGNGGSQVFLRQLMWREFAYHLLYHFPSTPERPLDPEFEQFPWQNDSLALATWQRGMTGYPLVDAGMRQLWETGYMHNRVRMIVASFLVKDLLVPWQRGAEWFWDTLVDADLANNTLGWQWVAGCGADAAPYFRIFNPVTQAKKFDPDGAYVRRWVPELSKLSSEWIQTPWEAPSAALANAGIELGKTYPHRFVDHDQARLRALEALQVMRCRPKSKVG